MITLPSGKQPHNYGQTWRSPIKSVPEDLPLIIALEDSITRVLPLIITDTIMTIPIDQPLWSTIQLWPFPSSLVRSAPPRHAARPPRAAPAPGFSRWEGRAFSKQKPREIYGKTMDLCDLYMILCDLMWFDNMIYEDSHQQLKGVT